MGAIIVVARNERIETRLLLQDIGGRRLGRFAVEPAACKCSMEAIGRPNL
jgi:hypothetical protein